MRNWKRIAGLCLAMALTFSQTAMADITITPLTPEAAASLNAGNEAGSAGTVVQETQAPAEQAPSSAAEEAGKEVYTGPGPWNEGASGQNGESQNQTGQNQTSQNQTSQNQGSLAQVSQPSAGSSQGALSYTAAVTAASSGSGGSGTETGSSEAGSGSVSEPQIQAQSAVLYDVTHGKVLYEKDARSKYYPASITKLLTALLVLENTNLTDMVTFSETATTNLEAGAVGLNVTAGDVISVKDCLYGMLLKSANEVANGLAEHVGGSISGFADMMNARAQALGCTGTHFSNSNGLNDSNHYTTAYDMALIAAEAFKNPTLCEITSTVNYTFPATKKVNSTRALTMGHKMINPADVRYYPGIVGGKTGYTSLAGNTLVTCAERDGLRLVVVILKSKQTHYDDTKALLDYGFALAAAPAAGSSDSGGAMGSSGGPGVSDQPQSSQAAVGSWSQDENGWTFTKADGTKASSENMMIDGSIYHFDDTSYMATGWRQMNGYWYYFSGSGALAVNRWLEDTGSWFYVGPNGNILTNTTTPDGYQVGETGAWVQ